MPRHGAHLWHSHPAVRSGNQLTLGERAADRLKAGFGSWPFLFASNGFMLGWFTLSLLHVFRFDPYPCILLNLILSWMAANQGGALQISSNRGDRISAEVALDTKRNTDDLKTQSVRILTLQEQQMLILSELQQLRSEILGGAPGTITRPRAGRE